MNLLPGGLYPIPEYRKRRVRRRVEKVCLEAGFSMTISMPGMRHPGKNSFRPVSGRLRSKLASQCRFFPIGHIQFSRLLWYCGNLALQKAEAQRPGGDLSQRTPSHPRRNTDGQGQGSDLLTNRSPTQRHPVDSECPYEKAGGSTPPSSTIFQNRLRPALDIPDTSGILSRQSWTIIGSLQFERSLSWISSLRSETVF